MAHDLRSCPASSRVPHHAVSACNLRYAGLFPNTRRWPRYAPVMGRVHVYRIQRPVLSLNGGATRAVERGENRISAWDDNPYAFFTDGKAYYLDVLDVFSFLNTPVELVPMDPKSYNPAVYLWKKIGDIPEERRNELLLLLQPRLTSSAWDIAGARYFDAKLARQCASSLLSSIDYDTESLELWTCRKSGGPALIAWISQFKMALFHDKEDATYGRFFGLPGFMGVPDSKFPLYFMAREVASVMASEEPCDYAFELRDGVFDIHHHPNDFPEPAKHPWPLDDEVVVYVRHVGPGVMVGQAWREGKAIQQLPRKFCGEILMVKSSIVAS